MSEQPKEEKHVDWREKWRTKRPSENIGLLKELLSSDKNNETKTRIPNVFGMTVLDLLGAWSSPRHKISFEFAGEKREHPKTVEGLAQYFGMRYRINAISSQGKSREEYVDASKSYFGQLQDIETQKEKRMDEGVRK